MWKKSKRRLRSCSLSWTRHSATNVDFSRGTCQPGDSLLLSLTQTGRSLDTAQAKLDALYAKQGRSDRFPSAEARDEYLTSEIETLESALEDTEADLEKQRGVVDAMKAKLEEVGQTRREREAEIAESKTTVEDKRLELERLRVEINGKQEQRK